MRIFLGKHVQVGIGGSYHHRTDRLEQCLQHTQQPVQGYVRSPITGHERGHATQHKREEPHRPAKNEHAVLPLVVRNQAAPNEE
jgi:hypothetical protein